MIRPHPKGLALFTALSLALFAGCSGSADAKGVVLVTLDTTRADALSCYGVNAGTTPHLDQLALEGILFERAYTVVPVTLPAHASMLSGLYPPRHGVRDNGYAPLPESAFTSAEAARQAGFRTAAFLAAVVLDEGFGLDQGFEVYDLPERPADWQANHPPERAAEEVVDAALAWLEALDADEPFFVWVHLYDPHGPYEPPAAFRRGPWGDDPYLGEVAAMDAELGRLLDALREQGRYDNTTFVVVGDHGEAFGEHGEVAHGAHCYQSTLSVPLLLREREGARAGERENGIASVVDIHPTLLEALDLKVPAGLDGRSLFEPPEPGRGVYFESYYGYLSYGWSPLVGWVDAYGKYLHSSEPLFFDISADPDEELDLIDERNIEDYLNGLTAIANATKLEAEEFEGFDEDVLEGLRGLGYTASGSDKSSLPPIFPLSKRPSPHSRSDLHERTVKALERIRAGNLTGAKEIYRDLLDENPRNWFVLEKLATLQMQANEPIEAIETLERLLAGGPQKGASYFKLGMCRRALGQENQALEALYTAVRRSRGSARFIQELEKYLVELGREEEAAALRIENPEFF